VCVDLVNNLIVVGRHTLSAPTAVWMDLS